MERATFDGWIAGLGTAGGTRIVIGRWPDSPLGDLTDVMLESPGGHRALYAPSQAAADLIATTYTFDEVVLTPVSATADGASWRVVAGPLSVQLTVGGRRPLAWLLRAVPGPLARARWWISLLDVPARLLLPGVRTTGSARDGRREWYGARDLHAVTAATVTLDGADLGPLRDVDPPVRFGFGSVPRSPSLVRVSSTVELARPLT